MRGHRQDSTQKWGLPCRWLFCFSLGKTGVKQTFVQTRSEVITIPRLFKKAKREWSLFLYPRTGRRNYNALCRRCTHSCKQSFLRHLLSFLLFESRRVLFCQLLCSVKKREKYCTCLTAEKQKTGAGAVWSTVPTPVSAVFSYIEGCFAPKCMKKPLLSW